LVTVLNVSENDGSSTSEGTTDPDWSERCIVTLLCADVASGGRVGRGGEQRLRLLERREWQEKKSIPSPILYRWSSDLVLAAAVVATAADEQSSATQGGDDPRR